MIKTADTKETLSELTDNGLGVVRASRTYSAQTGQTKRVYTSKTDTGAFAVRVTEFAYIVRNVPNTLALGFFDVANDSDIDELAVRRISSRALTITGTDCANTLNKLKVPVMDKRVNRAVVNTEYDINGFHENEVMYFGEKLGCAVPLSMATGTDEMDPATWSEWTVLMHGVLRESLRDVALVNAYKMLTHEFAGLSRLVRLSESATNSASRIAGTANEIRAQISELKAVFGSDALGTLTVLTARVNKLDAIARKQSDLAAKARKRHSAIISAELKKITGEENTRAKELAKVRKQRQVENKRETDLQWVADQKLKVLLSVNKGRLSNAMTDAIQVRETFVSLTGIETKGLTSAIDRARDVLLWQQNTAKGHCETFESFTARATSAYKECAKKLKLEAKVTREDTEDVLAENKQRELLAKNSVDSATLVRGEGLAIAD